MTVPWKGVTLNRGQYNQLTPDRVRAFNDACHVEAARLRAFAADVRRG